MYSLSAAKTLHKNDKLRMVISKHLTKNRSNYVGKIVRFGGR